MKKTENFRFEIKELGEEEGTFEGFLSKYGEIDLGKDVVEKGAFTKSIKESGTTRPILWQHDPKQPIGTLELEDRDEGLWVKGALLIDEVRQAREAYALIKSKVIKGLSIGFKTIRQKKEDGIRKLKELQLFEGSIVTFAMLPTAQIEAVKAGEAKADFQTELERAQVFRLRSLMFWALGDALDSFVWEWDMAAEERIEAVGESIDQFKEAYLSRLPILFELLDIKKDEPSGQPLGAAEKKRVEEMIGQLQALVGDAGDTSSTDAGGTSEDAASTSDDDAATTLADEAIDARNYLQGLKSALVA